MKLITFCGKIFLIRVFLRWHIVKDVINHVIIRPSTSSLIACGWSPVGLYQPGDDSHLYRDATEKVLILREVAQDKVYLYVLRYYILYAKTVFQWRPIDGEKQAGISGGSQSPS